MKQFRKVIIGGIESKLIALLTICILLLAGSFFGAGIFQSSLLTDLSAKTSKRQAESITAFSREMIERTLSQSMNRTTELEALVADSYFHDLSSRVNLLADYAAAVLNAPESFPDAPWTFPDASKNGRLSAMVMLADGVDASDPLISSRIGLVANLTEMMLSLCETFDADNAYVALPEGIHFVASRNAGGWYLEDGSLQSFDPRERYWYQEAAAEGKLVFTDVGDDRETGELCIVCARPVYGPDGTLLAVVGSDFFLTDIQEAVESASSSDEFHVVIGQKGQVIFSPREEGELKATRDTAAVDLRQAGNAELAGFLTDVMDGKTDVRLVKLSDGEYYMAAAQIPTIGWTDVSVFSQEKAEEVIKTLLENQDEIQEEAAQTYRSDISRIRTAVLLTLLAEAVLMIAAALYLGRRIVRPLNNITRRISQLREGDMEFKMDDSYRTGDEIEVLAESFANISHKTVEYVGEVKRVTAEKERIATELHMANRIQESMLPNTFPAFPDRSAFDIYASMSPAKEVGGDFYDFFFIDPDHLAIVIADVSGKGVPAALFMMISRTIIKNCAMLGKGAAQILEESNRALCSENKMEMFVTSWIGILQISTGRLTAANAGHEYPAIYHFRTGEFSLYKDRHSFVLGGMPNVRYREYELKLEPGDKLFIYTDGVAEASNSKEELFGTDRMLAALNAASKGSPKDILFSVRDAVDAFSGNAEQFDDLTMLCLEYKGDDN